MYENECSVQKNIVHQISATDKYVVPKCGHPIKCITDIYIRVKSIDKSFIWTCDGLKLRIKGEKVIKICYETCEFPSKTNIITGVIPFFELIPIDITCKKIEDIKPEVCVCESYVADNSCIYIFNVIELVIVSYEQKCLCSDNCKPVCNCNPCNSPCQIYQCGNTPIYTPDRPSCPNINDPFIGIDDNDCHFCGKCFCYSLSDHDL